MAPLASLESQQGFDHGSDVDSGGTGIGNRRDGSVKHQVECALLACLADGGLHTVGDRLGRSNSRIFLSLSCNSCTRRSLMVSGIEASDAMVW